MMEAVRNGAWQEVDEYGWFGIRDMAYFDGLETFDSNLSWEIDFIPYRYSRVTNNMQPLGLYYNDGANPAIRHYNTIENSDSSTWRFSSFVGTVVKAVSISSIPFGRTILKWESELKKFSIGTRFVNVTWGTTYHTDFGVYIGASHNYSASQPTPDNVVDLTTKMDFYGVKFIRNGKVTHDWVGKKVGGVWVPFDKITKTVGTNLGEGYLTGGPIETT